MGKNYNKLRKFVSPEVVYGIGSINLVGQYAKNYGARKVLVVTDPGVIAAGWTGKVLHSLDESNLQHVVFSNVNPNPRESNVMEGADFFIKEQCNIIVAVGGGSPIDCAKGIAIVSSNRRHVLEFEGVDKILYPIPPLICIPTTAGSSADVSQFAIIVDTSRKVKIAIISKAIVPDVALIDPETLITLSPYLTACTGMDALTHAIEAYTSTASSPITDLHALEAIKLISNNLLYSMEDPYNIEYRSAVMLGSFEAGLAFSNAILGAVHAMAHSLEGLLDLPHGECNALLLEHVIDYNYQSAALKYRVVGQAMGLNLHGLSDNESNIVLYKEIQNFKRRLGINRTLKEIGVKQADIPQLAKYAIQDPCIATNPCKPNLHDIEVIYEKAL